MKIMKSVNLTEEQIKEAIKEYIFKYERIKILNISPINLQLYNGSSKVEALFSSIQITWSEESI